MRLIFWLLVAAAAAVVVAIRMLPWWGGLALLAGLALAVAILLRWGLPRLLKLPFRAKGAVLRDAAVEVHSIERSEAPASEPSDEDAVAVGRGPGEHFRLDVTVTPRASAGPFTLWEPGELTIVGPDARAGGPEAGETAFDVRALEVREDGRFQPDSGMKYEGPQRLRLLVVVPRGQRRLRFRYYFEIFGGVSLPGSTTGDAFRRRPLVTTR